MKLMLVSAWGANSERYIYPCVEILPFDDSFFNTHISYGFKYNRVMHLVEWRENQMP
jgi:hypothetical protein